VGGETRNNGFYDPVRDKDRYYSRAARNPCENDPHGERAWSTRPQMDYEEHEPLLSPVPANIDQGPQHTQIRSQDRYLRLASRPLRPRKLCFLADNGAPPEAQEQSFHVRQGDEGDDGNAEYVFISYTRTEFCVEKKINPDWAARDRRELLRFAVTATRAAGVGAFWIDFECVVTDTANVEETGNPASGDMRDINEDVYRICDVVRGAHSMAVIIGPPYHKKEECFVEEDREGWLFLWASRMWVLPELLLTPTEHRVRIYTQAPGINPKDVEPEEVAKRNLAARSCSDAEDVRQLVDHYEGTVQLSQLELVQLALDCLQRRTTVGRTNADLAYALKGLLRRRPEITKNESGFEAFASLSLANDSQRLLERLVCMLPPDPDADWSDMRDAWGMQLWDIEPTCQIAGIVDDRTVLVDGAYGASIQWNRLETVAFIKRETALRTVGRICVRGAPIFFLFGVLLVATSSGLNAGGTNPILIIGAIALAFSLSIILAAPYLLMKIYLGKFWSTQAWFFGIEGAVDDLAKIERALFGFSENRLTWSANGSLLSRHHLNDFQECEAEAPEGKNIRDVVGRITFDQLRAGTQRNTDRANSPPSFSTTTQSGRMEPANSVHQTNGTRQSSENEPVPRQQKIFTIIDTYTMTATMFYAYHPPTTVLICGQEGGMQRAVLCSYDWKTQTYCRETVLRMKTLVLERMFRVDRFRFALKRH
jgi:hypothetical protein